MKFLEVAYFYSIVLHNSLNRKLFRKNMKKRIDKVDVAMDSYVCICNKLLVISFNHLKMLLLCSTEFFEGSVKLYLNKKVSRH